MGAFNSFHFYQSAVHHSSVLKIFGMAQQVKGRLMWSKKPQTNQKNKPKKTMEDVNKRAVSQNRQRCSKADRNLKGQAKDKNKLQENKSTRMLQYS